MKLFNKNHSKTKEEVMEMVNEDKDLEELKNAVNCIHIDTFEAIAKRVLEFETVVNSPIDGNPISVVRTEDALNCIADYYNIDIEKSVYSEFKK